ncbi:hypothetical protein [Psychrobacter cryohalolentis]|nr:hypothetical protein [Psychrobacter cryohalolentis]ASE27043.2 hypothetical protein CEP87_10800 [Psychrobacter cryohalolentis]
MLKINNYYLLFIIILFYFIKMFIFIAIKNDLFLIPLGGGSDANYYDNYALGRFDLAVNVWPVILRSLNDIGIYSREYISYLFFLLNLFFIPSMVSKISGLSFKYHQKYYLYIFLLCAIYPTLFIFTFDIYRDVFMVFIFLMGCFFVKKSLESSRFSRFLLMLAVSAIVGLFLLGLRPYLGYAFLLSLLLWKIKFTKRRIIFLGALYFLALFAANYVGIFNSLTEYRAGFEEAEGGSNLGIDFSNPIMFIPNFILSFLGQMLGLYITNPLAIVLLIVETVPFLFMLVYVIKNIRWADKFVRFLIVFFVLYASVWLIGNDNLGTAVRLRLYNYIAVYIAFFYILRLKSLHSRKIQVVKS